MTSRILIVFLLIIATAAKSHAEPVSMAINTWKPYVAFDESGIPRGIAVDKAQRIFTAMALKLAIVQMPFKRALASAESGKVDGILLSTDQKSRRAYLTLSRPIFCDRRVIYVPKGRRFNWQNLTELKGKTLGIGIGFYYGSTVEKWIDDDTVKTYAVVNSLTLFKMLSRHRMDFIAFSEREAEILLNEHPRIASNVERLEQPVSEIELSLGFALSRRGKYHSALSNKAIDQLGLGERCK